MEAIGKEPNTVQLKEFIFGKESSKAQIVMELCDGDLNQCLKGKYCLNKDNKFLIFQLTSIEVMRWTAEEILS